MDNLSVKKSSSRAVWLYVVTALFVAVALCLLVRKECYVFFALPVVLGVLLLYVYSIDKVMFLVALVTPLSVNIQNIMGNMSLSLPAEPLLMGMLIVYLANLILNGHYDKRIASHPISIVFYCMFIWMAFTTIASEVPLVSLKYILSRLWFIVPSFFFCTFLFKDRKNIDLFVWLYSLGLLIVVAYSIYRHSHWGFSNQSAHWVMTPFYNDHTAYGAALAMYFILALTYLFMPNVSLKLKIVIAGVVALLGLALMLSQCRTAWISVVAALGVLICVLLKIKFKWILTIAVVLMGLVFAFQNQIVDALEHNKQDASGDIVENIRSMTNISTDASNLERINRWQSAFRLFKERPIVGWGPGTYQFVYAPYQMSREKTIISTNLGDAGNAHSEYIGALAEMGVFGSLLMVAIVAVAVYCGLNAYKKAKEKSVRVLVLGVTLTVVSYFTHGFLNNFLDTDKLAVPVWSCLAIIAAIDMYHTGEGQKEQEVVENPQE